MSYVFFIYQLQVLHFTNSNNSFVCVCVCHCRLPVCYLSHSKLFRQNGDGSVSRQNRPQLTAGAGRLHICQGKHHNNRKGIHFKIRNTWLYLNGNDTEWVEWVQCTVYVSVVLHLNKLHIIRGTLVLPALFYSVFVKLIPGSIKLLQLLSTPNVIWLLSVGYSLVDLAALMSQDVYGQYYSVVLFNLFVWKLVRLCYLLLFSSCAYV